MPRIARSLLARSGSDGAPSGPKSDSDAAKQAQGATASRHGVIRRPDVVASSAGWGVEKPAPEDAPSNLAIIGRYVLTPKIFDKLEQTQRGSGGEIQLTDAIEALMEEQGVYGYEFEGVRYDAGTTMGWLKASVELALQRPDLAREFRAYLRGLELE